MGIIIDYKKVEIERADRLVMRDVSFTVDEGEFCYLVGRVGSGKSSLMKTMYADVDIHSGEKAEVLGFDLLHLKRRDIPQLRRHVGIVFQDFQLLQDRSAKANLRFVLEATGWKSKSDMEERIEEVLKAVGMENKSYKMPHELSGGEQQRIVIARALLNKPKLILADEPTGNLDEDTAAEITAILKECAHQMNKCVVIVTHSNELAKQADVIFRLKKGDLQVAGN